MKGSLLFAPTILNQHVVKRLESQFSREEVKVEQMLAAYHYSQLLNQRGARALNDNRPIGTAEVFRLSTASRKACESSTVVEEGHRGLYRGRSQE